MAKNQKKDANEVSVGVKRFWFIVNCIFTLNYLIWRTCFTVPWGGHLIALGAALLLLTVEALGMVEQFVHFYNMYNVEDYPLPKVPYELYPDIDIFISTYNEEEELLYKTINGCLNLDYPDLNKVHIYLIDDGHRAHIKEFAKTFGPRLNYLDRDTHIGQKAGNINHAISVTNSPYILTLDADMIVQSRFLMEVVPYLVDGDIKNWALPKEEEMRIGFIQTPQAFYDLDLFQFNLHSEAKIPNEQDYFYRDIQVAKTKSNSVIYGGSNTIISRKAIYDIGGFFTESITEDFATGCMIQKKGYVCLGTGKPLASGLSPNTIQGLIQQRVRWGRGVIDTGHKIDILGSSELNFMQKLNYWASIYYWYVPLKRLIYILAPILFATFGFEVMVCTLPEVLMFWAPMYVTSTISMKTLSGNRRNNKWTSVYETVMFPFMLIPILMETFGFSLKKFKVTQKAKAGSQKGKNFVYMVPSLILIAMSVFGIINSIRIVFISNSFGIAVMLFWLCNNLYIMVMGLFFMDGREAYRNAERIMVTLPCKLEVGGVSYDCVTKDISEQGVALRTAQPHLVEPDSTPILVLKDKKYMVRLKLKPIHVGPVRGGPNGGILWEYAFVIKGYDSRNGFDNLCGICYDRVPTHPEEVMESSIYQDLSMNFKRRTNIAFFAKRAYPRIAVDLTLTCDESPVSFRVFDFNYHFFAIENKRLPRRITLHVAGKTMICVRGAAKGKKVLLYEIENIDEVYPNQQAADEVMDWILQYAQGPKKLPAEKTRVESEFDEVSAVLSPAMQ